MDSGVAGGGEVEGEERASGGEEAEVRAVRVGGYCSVHDRRVLGDGRALGARGPGLGDRRPGARVVLKLDESQTFIFPRNAPDGVA